MNESVLHDQSVSGRTAAVSGSGSARKHCLVVLLALLLAAPGLLAQTYTVGTGTLSNSQYSYPAPYGTYYGGAKHQFLIRASELAGAQTGDITQIAFDVASLNGVDNCADFTISLKETTLESLTEFVTGVDQVFYHSDWVVTTGWNTYILDDPFVWDGTSNIIVEVCFNNVTWNLTYNASNRYTTTPFTSVVYYREDDDIDLCENPGLTGTSSNRPNMRLTIVPRVPMEYIGSTTYQLPIDISRGTPNAPVIVVEVYTEGLLDPLEISSFSFNTNGTTDVGDLENARLFYTGASTVYSTANQFGNVVANPNGTFTINGSMQLTPGSNYFWLAYDVAEDAELFNLLDGECPSVTVDGTPRTPLTTAPAGAATINLVYCQAYATSVYDTYIGRVALGDMDNVSPIDEEIYGATYTNYARAIPPANIRQELTYPMLVEKTTNGGNYSAQLTVFIDFNNDEDYLDAGERVFSTFISNAIAVPYNYIQNITIPNNSAVGLTGMRVVLNESGSSFDSPCIAFTYGEVEDYHVNILPAFPKLEIVGNTNLGTVGSVFRRAIQLRNSSPHLPLAVSGWSLNNGNFSMYLAGTNTPVPANFTLSPSQVMNVDLVFGGSGAAGFHSGTLSFTHNGANSPTIASVQGSRTTLGAWDDGNNLLLPNAVLDVGGVEIGAPPVTKNFLLGPVSTPLNAPVDVAGFELIGPDAALFDVSAIPPGLFNNATISVSITSFGATPGSKAATLRIYHSAANGPYIDVKLEGKVGQPVIGAPSLVQTPPAALGQTYNGPYDNVAFIPLTRPGAVDVEFYQTPVITGSGSQFFELAHNSGNYFLRGALTPQGQVVVGGNGDINHPANWKSAGKFAPVVVTPTQPWLLVVRLKEPGLNATPGSYNADMLLSNGSGEGVSNAVNYRQIALLGEVLNNPNILPLYPTSLAMGAVAIGTTVSRTLTVRNQSGVAKTSTLEIIGDGYRFSNGAKTFAVALPADNAPVLVNVFFSPAYAGPDNGSIRAGGIAANGGEGFATLSGTGLAASPGALSILCDGQPLSNNIAEFGNVAVQNVKTKVISIVNHNPGPVTVTLISRSGQNATQFATGMPTPTATIPGNGGSVSFDLNFAPTSTSNPVKTATVTVFNNTGAPLSFNARGTAVLETGDEVSVSFDPASYNFGVTGNCHDFKLMNNGSNAITVNTALILGSTNFSIDGGPAGFPRSVPAGGYTTISVCFDNTSGTNGLRTGTLLAYVPGVTPYPTAGLSGTVLGSYQGGDSDVDGSKGAEIISPLVLTGLYPNPANTATEVRFRLDHSVGAADIRVVDLFGRDVLTLGVGKLDAGEHFMNLDVSALSTGNYYLIMEADGHRKSATLSIIK